MKDRFIDSAHETEEWLRQQAKARLERHKGFLDSLTPEELRAISEMDPGPPAEIGRKP